MTPPKGNLVNASDLERFLRSVGDACIALADSIQTLDNPSDSAVNAVDDAEPASLQGAQLGTLQLQIAQADGMHELAGVSPREITRQLDRGDEPNIRDALYRMQNRGVVELVSPDGPQRWRLTNRYR